MPSLLEDTIQQQNTLAKMEQIKQRVHERRRQQQTHQTKKKERKSSVLDSLDFWESSSSLNTAVEGQSVGPSGDGSKPPRTPVGRIGSSSVSISSSSSISNDSLRSVASHRKSVRSAKLKKRQSHAVGQTNGIGTSIGTSKSKSDDSKSKNRKSKASWNGSSSHAGNNDRSSSRTLLSDFLDADNRSDEDSDIHDIDNENENDNGSCLSDPSRSGSIISNTDSSRPVASTTPPTSKRYQRRGSVIKHKAITDDVRLQPQRHLHKRTASVSVNKPDGTCSLNASSAADDATTVSMSSACTSTSNHSTKSAPATTNAAAAKLKSRQKRRTKSQLRRGSMVGSMSTDLPEPGCEKVSLQKQREAEEAAKPVPPPPPCIDEAPLGSLLPSPEQRRRRPSKRTSIDRQQTRSSSCGAVKTGSLLKAKAAKPARNPSSLSRLSQLPSVDAPTSCSNSRGNSSRTSPSAKSAHAKSAVDDVTVSTAETSTTASSLLSGDSLQSCSDKDAAAAGTGNRDIVVEPYISDTSQPVSACSSSEDVLSRSAHGRLQEHAKSSGAKCTRSSRNKRKSKSRKAKRSVQFSIVSVQEYPLMLGDNPSVTAGAPLTIGWIPIASYELNVDLHARMKHGKSKKHSSPSSSSSSSSSPSKQPKDAQPTATTSACATSNPNPLPKSSKRHRHAARREMYLSEHVRAQILLRAGYCLADIVDAGLEVQRIQKERADSLRKQQWEIVRDVFSKAGNAFSRILSVDTHLQGVLYPGGSNGKIGSSAQSDRAQDASNNAKPTSYCPQMA